MICAGSGFRQKWRNTICKDVASGSFHLNKIRNCQMKRILFFKKYGSKQKYQHKSSSADNTKYRKSKIQCSEPACADVRRYEESICQRITGISNLP